MDCNSNKAAGYIQNALDRLAPIYKSLDSLTAIKEGRYYYYDPAAKEFYQSAHGAMEFLDSYWGNGVVTGFLQPICRTASGENYKTLSDGIQAVYDSIVEESLNIELKGARPGIPSLARNLFLEEVDKLYRKIFHAASGIQQLVKLYETQVLKRDVFIHHHKQFNQELSKKIKDLYEKILIQQVKDEEVAKEIWIDEERKIKLAEESVKRKKIGDRYEENRKIAERRRIRDRIQRDKRKPDPRTGLSRADEERIQWHLKRYEERYHPSLEKLYKKNVENPCLYLLPSKTGLPWEIQYWSDKVVIHLKQPGVGDKSNVIGKGVYKEVTKSVDFKGGEAGKILANGCSILAPSEQNIDRESKNFIVAENERLILNQYRKVRGIVRVKKVSQYISAKGALEQSILMKYYNLGNLLGHIKKKDLSREHKNTILLDILHGLARLHKDGYINFDIKPDNILLENTSKRARENGISGAIGDFGLCCRSDCIKPDGSLYYIAPEVVAAMYRPIEEEYVTKVGCKADIWSLGCTFWLLYVGSHTPWMEIIKEEGDNLTRKAREMMNKDDAIPEPEKETIKHLLWTMMRPNPDDRPTALEALKQLNWLLMPSKDRGA